MVERLESYLAWWNGLTHDERDRFHNALKANKVDPRKKAELKALAKHFIRTGISWSCGSCIQDAHYLLIRLKPEDMDKKALEYELYPGTILHDPINKNFDLMLMPPKLNEGLALYHLTFNARAEKYFVKTPADVDKRIADYLSGLDDEMKAKALPSAIKALNKYAAKPKAKKAAPAPKAEPETDPEAPEEQGETPKETAPEQVEA